MQHRLCENYFCISRPTANPRQLAKRHSFVPKRRMSLSEPGPSGAAVAAAKKKSKHLTNRLVCPDHPHANLIEDYAAGDMICPECGLVVGDRVIDVGTEWRTFNNDSGKGGDDPSRVGATENPLLAGGDLSTIIGTGKMLPGSYDADFSRLNSRRGGMSGSDRALMMAFREVNAMADRINLPRMIIDRANGLFKQVHSTKVLKGRSNDAIASACLYIACRQEGVPRTFKEIVAISKVTKKEIGRCFKLILKTLETSVDLITTGDFMSRFCSNLGLTLRVQKAATTIAKRAVELDMTPGRSPVSVAAAAIYMASQASGENKSAKEIGDTAGVAEVTIRQSFKLMVPRAPELFPDGFNFAVAPQCIPPP